MSERLTDEELSGYCVAWEIGSPMERALNELRERRAADLTDDERKALLVGRISLLDSMRRNIGHPNALDMCVEVLERLLGGGAK